MELFSTTTTTHHKDIAIIKNRRYYNSRRNKQHLSSPPIILQSVLLLLLFFYNNMSFFCSAFSSSSQLLKGKRVLVTGGGRGIGRAIALICHEEGAKVVITSRTKSELEETIRLANDFATTEQTTEADANSANGDDAEDADEKKKLRLKRSAMAAALLSRRGGQGASSSSSRAVVGAQRMAAALSSRAGKGTSVGARREGSASKARMGRSSVSQVVDAVKTGSSSMNTGSSSSSSESNKEDNGDEGNTMVYYVCDVTNESDVESMVQNIVGDGAGEIDVLINNAGGSQSPKGPVGTLNGQDLESLLKLNVISPQLVTSAVCKHSPSWTTKEETTAEDNGENEKQQQPHQQQQQQKVILNISSKAGKVGLQNYSFYVASKFALEGLASSWSKELRESNVRVHSLSPGMVDTQSFPKPPGKKGVREASSIRDCLLFALTGSIRVDTQGNENDDKDAEADTEDDDQQHRIIDDMMDYTGHYIHVDEYDQVIREKGVKEAHLAWKPIDEDPFRIL